jgi:hypothetical protein
MIPQRFNPDEIADGDNLEAGSPRFLDGKIAQNAEQPAAHTSMQYTSSPKLTCSRTPRIRSNPRFSVGLALVVSTFSLSFNPAPCTNYLLFVDIPVLVPVSRLWEVA